MHETVHASAAEVNDNIYIIDVESTRSHISCNQDDIGSLPFKFSNSVLSEALVHVSVKSPEVGVFALSNSVCFELRLRENNDLLFRAATNELFEQFLLLEIVVAQNKPMRDCLGHLSLLGADQVQQHWVFESV